MGAWNINYGTDLIASMSQSTFANDTNNNSAVTNNAGSSSDYAKILAEKVSEINEQFEDMQKNSQSRQNSQNSSPKNIETIKRFMPDGSIMITTYEDGKISSRIKKRPHLVPVADYSKPSVNGEPAMKMVQQFSLADLLMM